MEYLVSVQRAAGDAIRDARMALYIYSIGMPWETDQGVIKALEAAPLLLRTKLKQVTAASVYDLEAVSLRPSTDNRSENMYQQMVNDLKTALACEDSPEGGEQAVLFSDLIDLIDSLFPAQVNATK